MGGATKASRERVGATAVRRLLGGGLAVVSLLVSAGSASAEPAAGARAGGQVRVEGIVGAVHADPIDGRGKPYLETFVSSERNPGQSVAVTFPRSVAARYGGIEGLASKRVVVTAVADPRGRNRGRLTAVAVDVQGDASKGVDLDLSAGRSSKPTLTVLCKFDSKGFQPQNQSYFQGLTGDNGLMDTYFRDVSYQQIDLLGSKVAPATGNWYELPFDEAAYLTPQKEMHLEKLYQHCSGQATQNFNLDDFAVINLVFNSDLVDYSFGGEMDGRRVTWLTPKGWAHGGTTAHELGHAFGMTHTGLTEEYDNAWDVMSGSGLGCAPHPTYMCTPQQPSGYNKLQAGWLGNRVAEVPQHSTTTVELVPLEKAGSGTVLARIAPTDPEAHHAYYVEYRRPVGLDANLPFEGALGSVNIYEYWESPNTEEPGEVVTHVQLMGSDGGAGARWLPGMVFDRVSMYTGNECLVDPQTESCKKSPIVEASAFEFDGINIRIDAITATKATVTFTQLPMVPVYAGTTTAFSYELHWDDSAKTETYFKITAKDDKKKTTTTVNVPPNSTSYTFQNAPSGVSFTNYVQACNAVACGMAMNTVTTGADETLIQDK